MGRDSDGSIVSLRHKFTRVGKTPLKVKCLGKEWKYLLYCQQLTFFTCVIVIINDIINEVTHIKNSLKIVLTRIETRVRFFSTFL